MRRKAINRQRKHKVSFKYSFNIKLYEMHVKMPKVTNDFREILTFAHTSSLMMLWKFNVNCEVMKNWVLMNWKFSRAKNFPWVWIYLKKARKINKRIFHKIFKALTMW
jgi:hypothetical protein